MSVGTSVGDGERIEPQLGNEPPREFYADPDILPVDAAEPVADFPPEPQPGLEPQPGPEPQSGPKNITRDPETAGLSERVVATAQRAEVAEAAGVGGVTMTR